MTCEAWDVVVVPFPFADRRGAKRRPALTLSNVSFNEHGHSVLAMITTRKHSSWPGDVEIEDRRTAGLPVPCIVRLKLFTLDNRLLSRRIGRLAGRDCERVAAEIRTRLL